MAGSSLVTVMHTDVAVDDAHTCLVYIAGLRMPVASVDVLEQEQHKEDVEETHSMLSTTSQRSLTKWCQQIASRSDKLSQLSHLPLCSNGARTEVEISRY
jgi:hypothetical protein